MTSSDETPAAALPVNVHPALAPALARQGYSTLTPVQTAVKREDEQEFARLNGQNLMFIEDAGRKLKLALVDDTRLADFWVRIEHHESLHAHDAVGVFTKGVSGGYAPVP